MSMDSWRKTHRMSYTCCRCWGFCIILTVKRYNPACSCCLSNELGVSKLLEVSGSKFRAHVPNDPQYCNTTSPTRASSHQWWGPRVVHWCPFLDPRLTTYHSNTWVQIVFVLELDTSTLLNWNSLFSSYRGVKLIMSIWPIICSMLDGRCILKFTIIFGDSTGGWLSEF